MTTAYPGTGLVMHVTGWTVQRDRLPVRLRDMRTTTPAVLLAAALLAGCATSGTDGQAAGAGSTGQQTVQPTVRPTVAATSGEQAEDDREPSEPPPAGTAGPAPTSAGPEPTAEPEPTAAPGPTTEPQPPTQPSADPAPEPTSAPSADPAPEPAEQVLRPGDTGDAVLAVQQRLTELGYWLGPADGDYGDLTRQAVLAVQKAAGIGRDGLVGPSTRAVLDQGVRPQAQHGGDGVEIDLDRQLLLVVRGGAVRTVLNTSTGTFEEYVHDGTTYLADTPRGTWQVSWAVDGVREGELGRLYRPRYFHRDGIAVHGYPSVPAYPASHGCARVSNAAMDMIWAQDLMPRGSTVHVY